MCIMLSRAETHSGALEWFKIPIVELIEWVNAVEMVEKQTKARKK